MKKIITSFFVLLFAIAIQAQLNPAITSWLQNNTETGSFYMVGNSTAIDNGVLYNCQLVEYSDDFVYVHTKGIPAYPTGPFQDGNPSQAEDQDAIFKMPLFPQENTGNPQSTNPGNIGVFINGVALFDYRDGVAWNPQTNNICGGPGNPPCPGGMGAQHDWNRDAIPAERAGFDCSKAHPAMGNYHHHQNPSAFKLDLEVISDVCNLYDAEGLYAIDPEVHSPLIGFAYDGFPIYGAYGYQNTDGTGDIVRIKSSYQLKDITTRPNGPDVDQVVVTGGPNGGEQVLFLGYFREDYEYIAHDESDYLDEHNGRFCVTPEYPDGIYCYFATVDENWNSAYPYVVGPTFYGQAQNRSVNSVNESTTIYDGTSFISETVFNQLDITVLPNPASDLIAVQLNTLVSTDFQADLVDMTGKTVASKTIKTGTTIAYFDVSTVYEGTYFVVISGGNHTTTKKVVVMK